MAIPRKTHARRRQWSNEQEDQLVHGTDYWGQGRAWGRSTEEEGGLSVGFLDEETGEPIPAVLAEMKECWLDRRDAILARAKINRWAPIWAELVFEENIDPRRAIELVNKPGPEQSQEKRQACAEL